MGEQVGSSLRGLLQVVGDQLVAVSAALARLYESAFVSTDSVSGVYRGTVVNVVDPQRRGRVQVLVPVVAAVAVWAPVSGVVGALAVGEIVWVAYEAAKPDYPVVIGSGSPAE